MVKLTRSLQEWLFRFHPEKLGLIMFGHVELLTDEMCKAYTAWCLTDEGKQFLKPNKEETQDGTCESEV